MPFRRSAESRSDEMCRAQGAANAGCGVRGTLGGRPRKIVSPALRDDMNESHRINPEDMRLILLLNENANGEKSAKFMPSLAGLYFLVEPFPQGFAQRQAAGG